MKNATPWGPVFDPRNPKHVLEDLATWRDNASDNPVLVMATIQAMQFPGIGVNWEWVKRMADYCEGGAPL